jgi:hypothetical protein
MAYYLLDTDAIIDYLAGVASSVKLIQDLHNQGDLLCVCDVVVAEVHSGLRPQDREKAEKLLSACSFLSTEAEDARLAGVWRYEYARRGVTLSTTDVLVAATAHGHKASIVTGNKDDYPLDEVDILPLPRSKH